MAKTILVADDDDKILGLLESRLEASGFKVIRASDGQVAVHKARTEHPDLIILDILMPKMDGTEAGRILKEDNATKDIPIIYLTALKSESDEEFDQGLGGSVVLAKPFNPALLIEKIDELIASP